MDSGLLARTPAREVLTATTVAAFVLVVYAGAFDNQAVWDDDLLTTKNAFIASLRLIPDLFTHDMWSASGQATHGLYYRPVVMTTFALNRWVGGNTATSYHVGNVLLHVCVALAVLALARRTLPDQGPGAMTAALGFALLPTNVEAVAWTSGRFDVLVTLFAVTTVLLAPRRSAGGMIGTTACFGLALLSKESAVALPLIVLARELIFEGRPRRQSLLLYAAFFLALCFYFFVRHAVGLQHASIVDHGWSLLTSYGYAVFHYLPRGVVPIHLDAFHPYMQPAVWQYTTGIALGLAGIVIMGWLLRRSQRACVRAAAFGWAWFLASLLPVAFAGPELDVLGDRYGYVPAVGLWIVVGAGFQALYEWLARHGGRANVSVGVVAGVVWCSLGWAAALRAEDWRDERSLFLSSLRTNPSNHIAHRSLAAIAARESRFDEANEHVQRAVALAPGDWRSWNVACLVQLNRNELVQAEAACRRSLSQFDGDPSPWVNLASVHVRARRWAEAVEAADRALHLAPNKAEARYLRAVSLANLGRIQEAVSEVARVLELQPDHAGARDFVEQLRSRGYWP